MLKQKAGAGKQEAVGRKQEPVPNLCHLRNLRMKFFRSGAISTDDRLHRTRKDRFQTIKARHVAEIQVSREGQITEPPKWISKGAKEN